MRTSSGATVGRAFGRTWVVGTVWMVGAVTLLGAAVPVGATGPVSGVGGAPSTNSNAGAATSAGAPTDACEPAIPDPGAPTVPSGGYHPIRPERIFDTRPADPVAGGCSVVVPLPESVPAQANGVALEVIAVNGTHRGFVTASPCGSARPLVSSLNLRVGAPVGNVATVAVDATHAICFFASDPTDLVVDLQGWFGPGGHSLHPVAPVRALDTRTGPRPDGGSGKMDALSTIEVPLAGFGEVAVDAAGVAANFTITGAEDAGFLTVYPCGGDRPETSNLNYTKGDTRASHQLVGLDGEGDLCVFSTAAVELIIDLVGWFGGPGATRMYGRVPTRVADTREPGAFTGAMNPGETRAFDPTAAGTVAAGSAVALDIVATNAAADGFVTVYPCGGEVPETSTVNFHPDEDVANHATMTLGEDGMVCVFSTTSVHVAFDVFGSYGPGGALRSLDLGAVTLMPAFSPDAHDYGVVCATGTNTWTVEASGVPGSVVSVAGGSSSAEVTLEEGSQIDVVVTLESGTEERYVIRCLPADFPAYTVDRPESPMPGWYLTTLSGRYLAILDDHGGVVWWRHGEAAFATDLKVTPSGNLSYWRGSLVFAGVGLGDVREFSLEGTLVHNWTTASMPTDAHDADYLPSGNVLVGAYPQRDNVDISVLGPGFTSPASVLDTTIQEVRPDGSVAWEWNSEDHIGIAETTAHLDGVPIAPGGVVDLTHWNSAEVDPATGDVIASFRHLDAVLRIRRNPGQPDDGKVIWKLGGNAPTDPETKHLTLVDDPLGGVFRQHDARVLPNGDLSIFDNQTARAGAVARGVVYRLDLDAATATLVSSTPHPDAVISVAAGSYRVLPDGSRVVGWGLNRPAFTDFGPTGALSLSLDAGSTGGTYRALKVAPATFDVDDLRDAIEH